MRIVEDVITELTKTLLRGANIFYYKNRRFLIEEYEYANPIDFTGYVRITIRPDYGFSFGNRDIYSVIYDGHADEAREVACFKLATEFVNKELPRIDREIREELHNREIERTLAVLD